MPSQIDWTQVPLGKVPDRKIVETLKVPFATVAGARRRLGIAPFTPSARRGINWDAQPLGKVPDSHLAKELGVRPTTVCNARHVRNIPSYTETYGG